jgi:hypothetical protein
VRPLEAPAVAISHAVIHGNGQGGTDGTQQDGRYFLGIYLYQQFGSRAASGLTTAAADSI